MKLDPGYPFIVVDLDGTLTDMGHRVRHVTGGKRDFEAFYAGMADDGINWWCKVLVESLIKAGIIVVLLSARPKKYESVTKMWLADHGLILDGEYGIIRLRLLGREDGTPDYQLKREWFNRYPDHRASIVFAVDDRPRVVRMWREEGVTCLQCGTQEGG